MQIQQVEPESHLLQQVIDLGDRNSKFLGHFPREAFKREAGRGRIIAAVGDSGMVAGYVLYRTTADRAVIQHLCVDEAHRKSGIARRLIDDLRKRVAHLPAIICHVAREYTESLAAWKALGFVFAGEKTGRGADQRPLCRMRLDLGHATLFSDRLARMVSSKVVVALDTNVALAMQDGTNSDEEIRALTLDWLTEEVGFWVTDEAASEILRQDDTATRRRSLSWIRSFDVLSGAPAEVREVGKRVHEEIGCGARKQDSSDIQHLVKSIVGGADVFLTRDAGLLKHSERIKSVFGLEVLRPADLVLRMDEIARNDEYAPVRLEGTSIRMRPLRHSEIDAAIDLFLNYGKGEKKCDFDTRLRGAIADPAKGQATLLVDGAGSMLALICSRKRAAHTWNIELIRVRLGKLSGTLSRYLIVKGVRDSLDGGAELTLINDRYANRSITEAAGELGFVDSSEGWFKHSFRGLVTHSALLSCIPVSVNPELSALFEFIRGVQSELEEARDPGLDWAIEKLIWPAMLAASHVPSFVVSIQPRYAQELFDAQLSSTCLFDSDPTLMLSTQNVYYRSSHQEVVRAPGRILWYVSSDQSQSVRSLRATSLVEGIEVGPASQLYKKYARLGVYRWEDVREIAKNHPEGQVMAIRFGPVEMFTNPMPGADLRRVIAKHRGGGEPPLTAPVEIPRGCLEEILESCYGR